MSAKKIFLGSFVALVALGIVIGVSNSGESPTPSQSTNPTVSAPQAPNAPPAPTENTPLQVGQTANLEGLQITVSPFKSTTQFGQKYLCTYVSYVNGTDRNVNYNGGFDWKLQDPNNNIVMTSFGGLDPSLSAGELAPGGKVNGNVCFNNPGLKGTYRIQNEELISFSSNKTEWLAEVK